MFQFFVITETKVIPNQLLPEIQTENKIPKFYDSNVNITSREPVIRRPRSNPITETPYADQAIQRWKDKMMNQSQSKPMCIWFTYEL